MDITVKNVTKRYGTQRAVDDISFVVKTGEVLGFLGPNGAGKTTTMKAISCYLAPNDGDILVGTNSVVKHPENVKQSIGYLPEHNPLYLEMGVIDYLRFVGDLQGVDKTNLEHRVSEMVKVCGLQRECHKRIGALSKGYRQRVGLAQALIHDPEVLILDEPTTGLDPNQIVEIRELIKKIGREKTVILSSHILAEVEATCDRILIINKGKIVADGTAEELRKQAQGNELLQVNIADADLNTAFEKLRLLPTIQEVDFTDNKTGFIVQSKAGENSSKAIFKLCVEHNWYITHLSPIETKLEDVFRDLTLN